MDNALAGAKVYLAGPVERTVSDDWRQLLTNKLKKYNLEVLNPLVKPKWFIDNIGDLNVSQQIKDKEILGKLDHGSPFSLEYQDYLSAYDRNLFLRQVCLRLVSITDFVICYVSDVPTVGTYEELCLANSQYKPILFFSNNKSLDSCWRYVQFYKETYEVFYKNMDCLLEFLDYVNNSPEEMDCINWIFLKGKGWND